MITEKKYNNKEIGEFNKRIWKGNKDNSNVKDFNSWKSRNKDNNKKKEDKKC